MSDFPEPNLQFASPPDLRTLSPRRGRIPEKPAQEIAVAVAGPAVNVVIWGFLTLLLGADTSLDAWIIWGIWQKANPTLAESVRVEKKYRIYRDTGVGLTAAGKANPDAAAFVAWLTTPPAQRIFVKWGWIGK